MRKDLHGNGRATSACSFIKPIRLYEVHIQSLPNKQVLDQANPNRHLVVQSLKVNDGETRIICEICLKSTMKTPERKQRRCFDVFIVKLELT